MLSEGGIGLESNIFFHSEIFRKIKMKFEEKIQYFYIKNILNFHNLHPYNVLLVCKV